MCNLYKFCFISHSGIFVLVVINTIIAPEDYILVQIDDREPLSKTFFYVSSNPYGHFLKPLILADDLSPGRHTVRISIDPTPIDKVAMFTKRGIDLDDMSVFEKQRTYIGDIIIKGDIVE